MTNVDEIGRGRFPRPDRRGVDPIRKNSAKTTRVTEDFFDKYVCDV
jgi:hypothetical protein